MTLAEFLATLPEADRPRLTAILLGESDPVWAEVIEVTLKPGAHLAVTDQDGSNLEVFSAAELTPAELKAEIDRAEQTADSERTPPRHHEAAAEGRSREA